MRFILYGLEDVQRIMLKSNNALNKIQQLTVEEETALPFLKETRYREAVNKSLSYTTAPEISTSSPNNTAQDKLAQNAELLDLDISKISLNKSLEKSLFEREREA